MLDMLEWLHKFFPLKLGFSNTDMYPGVKFHKTRLHNGVWAWAISLTKYIKEAVRIYMVHLLSNYGSKYRIHKKVENPLKMGYDPELDTSPDLDSDTASYYLTIIGILRWMVELGKIKIMTKVSLLLSHITLPREEHLEVAVYVTAYVCRRYNSR